MGDGRGEGLSAIGDGGQAAVPAISPLLLRLLLDILSLK